MELLIDIGNTSLKWATCECGVVGAMRTVRHHGGLPIDLHATWEGLSVPDQVLVSNVGGRALADALARTCYSRWLREPRFVRTEPRRHGVAIAYESPEELGVDRWLAMLAAHRGFEGPSLIVDAGTAVTYDLILADGLHLGGLILPGINMMREGLLSGTRIQRAEPGTSVVPWAADTATAISAGPVQALGALADRLRDRLWAEAGTEPQIILSGGDAQQLIPAIGGSVSCQVDLVLRGLALLLT